MTIPRPEHPRPNLYRDHWLNLNGAWRFAFDPKAVGEPNRWYHPKYPKDLTIQVPYPWESPLSGVCAPEYKGAAWYEREITIPADWQGYTPHLNFGAIDWNARVWINGRFVAENDNGYLPFSIDLSPYVQPGETATITVRAYDIADASTLVGKQVPFWYIHSSGIWQTVWLERRASNHVTAIRVEPDVANEQALVKLSLQIAQSGSHTVTLTSPDGSFSTVESHQTLEQGSQQITLNLSIPNPQLWSPESPNLYNLTVELTPADGGPGDSVSSYFGMRTVSRGQWNENSYEYILLNGEPVYLRGALDQAFHPDGVHAYPSDDVIRGDIQLAKDLGLNMLRCHIKINDPRYYYWADKLGLLIMYDLPCPVLDTPKMRQTFVDALHGSVGRDFNSPSIFAWVLFNETWGLTNQDTVAGQRWLQEIYHHAKVLDPTRLVEDNSPCLYDHVESDINSWHFYINDYHQVRRHIQQVVDSTYTGSDFNYVGGEYLQSNAPLMNSEYGGISARMGDQDISWCFKYQTSELRRHAKICGYVYTELDDIEWEHNGFVNYDRSRKEFGYEFFVSGMGVDDLNSADFVGFDAPPCQTVPSGSDLTLPLFVSHWGRAMGSAQVQWHLKVTNRFGESQTVQNGSIEIMPQQFDVTMLDPLHLSLPDEPGLATIALQLMDEAGNIRCRNYVNVEIVQDSVSERASPLEVIPNGWALHFAPGAFNQTSWPIHATGPNGVKFSAQGSGWVDYELAIPELVNLEEVTSIRLSFEASARSGMAKVAWKQRIYGMNYPQTEEEKYPTDLTVMVNGTAIGEAHLPDDPADARGTLSHHHNVDPGSYGYLTELVMTDETVERLKQQLVIQPSLMIRFAILSNAGYIGGLALYGETVGCYPLNPTLFFERES